MRLPGLFLLPLMFCACGDRSPTSTEDSDELENAVTADEIVTETFVLPGGANMEFVWIEPGTFTMGTTEEQKQLLQSKGMWESPWNDEEQPAHQVTISRGFYLGIYEITQEQWESVMGTRPWEWEGRRYPESGPNYSAIFTWYDAQEFIQRLNQAEGGSAYRLPTEAEWEYACKAGTTTLWPFGNDESQLGNYAHVWTPGQSYLPTVGTKWPNPWGLYDMHGLRYEWCQDWFGVYTSGHQTDPTGSPTGRYRIKRGSGSVFFWKTRPAIRAYGPPEARNSARLVWAQ